MTEGLALTQVLDPALAGFDTIIDLRAPLEFAEDHLPGAINLPVLDDDERAQVGTIYKQINPFEARKLGAALLAANTARHLLGPLAGKPGGWRPLVYCWRGGMRSGGFATILQQIGWRVTRLQGGYKSWRHQVVSRVQDIGFPSPVIVLDGNTGSAKTQILHRLAARGHQVIDLEGLAQHRGSLFGAVADGQPSQKLFEGRLAAAIESLDPERPVWVEGESSRIGRVTIPAAVWRGICTGRRLHLSVPLPERAAYTARAYADLIADPVHLEQLLHRLRPLHSSALIDEWRTYLHAADWVGLAEGLLRHHYDPRYERHRARYTAAGQRRVMVDSLHDLERVALLVEAAATKGD